MNFISGGFIPTVFLPKSIQSLAPYMLTNVLSKQIGNIFLGEFDIKGFLSACEILIGIYVVTAIIVTIKDKVWEFNGRIFYKLNKKFIKTKKSITKKVGK
jgi:hypothetical protein